MIIRILHQYHHNMHDAVKALETIAQVEFLSYRQSTVPSDIINHSPKTLGRRHWAYSPFSLWQLLSNDTNLLILKDPTHPRNLFPILTARLKKIHCVVIIQQKRKLPWPINVLVRLIWHQVPVTAWAMTQSGLTQAAELKLPAHYIPICINVKKFSPANLSSTNNTLKLLSVAKYQPRKNIASILAAVHALRLRYSRTNFHLTIIGTLGQNQERRLHFAELTRLVTQYHLQQHVQLLADLPHSTMPEQYRQAHIFILPASREPLGLAILEAMAAGLPVIVSRDAGAASYVVDNENGYLISPGSSEEIHQKISNLLTDQGTPNTPLLQKLGTASRARAVSHHSPEVFLEKFQPILKEKI